LGWFLDSAHQHGKTPDEASDVAVFSWRSSETLFPDDLEHLAALSELIRRWVSYRWHKPITKSDAHLMMDAGNHMQFRTVDEPRPGYFL
jgi:hypothetical protein